MSGQVVPIRRPWHKGKRTPCFRPVLFSWWDDAVKAANIRAGATGRRQVVRAAGSLWRVFEVDL